MNRIVSSMIVGLAGIQGFTLLAESRPKLLVGIIVDQLRTDYLETLQDKFTTGGFKRLMSKGAFFKDVDFKVPNLDEAGATAILQTGSYPRQNGVAAAALYNPAEKKFTSVFQDPSYIGNFTTENYSPSSLRVSTLSDEIAIDSEGASSIHSIAPDPEVAIILSGHAGNSAFWINDDTGKWASTTYYTSQPTPLQNKNYNSPLVSRLDTMRWVPAKPATYYPDINPSRIKEGFRYTFPRSDRDVFRLYKNSPYVNTDVTEAACEYLHHLNLGKKQEVTDVLNIAYTLAPYSSVNKGDGKFELEDSYLRLDRDLDKLFKDIDTNVGLENVIIYLASTGSFSETERDHEKFRIPTGSFSVKRALSLLNAYLAAKYGNGAYVDQFASGHIYLDKNTIEDKGLNLNNVAEDARDFLVRMSGVADAYTIADLQSPAVQQLEGHRLGNDPKSAGDIIMEFNPGWKVIDDSRFPPENLPVYSSAYPTPVFIMGPGVQSETINETIDATAIAPTIARLLRIRSPNSSVSKPLSLK